MCSEGDYQIFFKKLLDGDRKSCSAMAIELLEKGVSLSELYINFFQRALVEIGEMWQKNKISVAKEHLCTAIIQSIMMLLYNYVKSESPNGGRVLIACIGKELHEVGARMVSDFFEIDGWEVTYLGANVPGRDIIRTVEEIKPHVLGISCTMTNHIEAVKDLIVSARDIKENAIIAVGGYCFNMRPDLYRFVEADFWASNAHETVEIARSLWNERRAVD